MRTSFSYLCLLLFLSVLLTHCGKDLETYEAPNNFFVNIELTQVDDVLLSAVIQNKGNFKIIENESGFLISNQPFDCEDQVDVIPASLNGEVLTASNFDLVLGEEYYVSAFLKIEDPDGKQTRRVCSGIQTINTGTLSLVNLSQIVEQNKVQVKTILTGLTEGKTAKNHGFFWIGPVDKLTEIPDLQTTFVNASTNNKIELGDISAAENIFNLDLNAELGKYYYLSSFVEFEDEIIFNEDGFEEIFLGDFWSDKSIKDYEESPGSIIDGIGFSLNGKGYVGLGLNADIGLTNQFWEYTVETDSWRRLADFPGVPRRLAAGFVLGDKIYMGTGTSNSADVSGGGCSVPSTDIHKDFYEYDPKTDTWTKKADFPTNRVGASAFTIKDKGYMGTGYLHDPGGAGTGNSRALYEYDSENDTWTKMELMNTNYGRRRSIGFAINDVGYIAAGVTSSFYSRALYRFDRDAAELGTWTETFYEEMSRRYAPMGFVIGDRAFVGGGSLTNSCAGIEPNFFDFWMYNPEENSWSKKADIFNNFLYGAATFVIDGKGYLWSGSVVSDFPQFSRLMRIYTPEKEVFEKGRLDN